MAAAAPIERRRTVVATEDLEPIPRDPDPLERPDRRLGRLVSVEDGKETTAGTAEEAGHGQTATPSTIGFTCPTRRSNVSSSYGAGCSEMTVVKPSSI
jgi:hypothetical protein